MNYVAHRTSVFVIVNMCFRVFIGESMTIHTHVADRTAPSDEHSQFFF